MLFLSSLTKPLVQFPVIFRTEGENGHFTPDAYSLCPVGSLFFHCKSDNLIVTSIVQDFSRLKLLQSLYTWKNGEAENFVTYDESTVGGGWSLDGSSFVVQPEEDTLRRGALTISLHLFSKTRI